MSVNRPKYNGPETDAIFIKHVEAKLKQYLGEDSEFEKSVEDVMQALHYERDPYQATKALDYDGWNADSELYDVIEDLIGKRYDSHRAAVENWVKENNLKPEFSIGNTVKFQSQCKEYTGEIVGIYEKSAEYSIFCEEMGHVKRGAGRLGIIIGYENVTSASELDKLNCLEKEYKDHATMSDVVKLAKQGLGE